MYHVETDFGDGVLSLSRTYNSYGDVNNSPSAYSPVFGPKWSFNFGLNVSGVPAGKRVLTSTGRWRVYSGGAVDYVPKFCTLGNFTSTGAGYIETLYSGEINYFDTQGRLTKSKDAADQSITLDYSQADYVKIYDEFGRFILLHKNPAGNIDQATDPSGNSYLYTYENCNLKTLTFPDGTVKTYEYMPATNLLTSITMSKDGRTWNVARWSYSGERCVSSSIDGTNDSVTVSYNTSTLTTAVTDSRNSVSTYTFAHVNDGVIKTTGVTGNCGCTSATGAYDISGNVTLKTDRLGNQLKLSGYTTRGKPGRVDECNSSGNIVRSERYTYHSATGRPASIKKASIFGNISTGSQAFYKLDPFKNTTCINRKGYKKTVFGNTSAFSYSTHSRYNRGRIVSSTNHQGRVMTFEYYSTVWGGPNHGRLKKTTNQLGQSRTLGNYSTGHTGRSVDENGIRSIYRYDTRGRLVGSTTGGRTTRYGYDAFGNRTSVTYSRGNRAAYRYDTANRLMRILDGAGNYIAYSYDTEGNRTREEIHDSSGVLKKYRDQTYNPDNRLSSTSNPSALYGYDAFGNTTTLTDGRGNATHYRFDALNRMTATVQPPPDTGANKITTSYTYDTNDNITAVTDGRGNVTHYTYDDFGRLWEVDSPDSGKTRYEYDANGNMTKKREAVDSSDDRITQFDYDGLNRITQIRRYKHDGTLGDTTNYTYDSTANGNFGVGRLTGITDSSGTTANYYNEFGEIVKVEKTFAGLTSKVFTTSYFYDANGNVTEVDYPDGRKVHYDYDSQIDQVVKVWSEKYAAVKVLADNIKYEPFGGISSYTMGDGLKAERRYDSQGRLTYLKSGPMEVRAYDGYDGNGNITHISDLVHPEKSQSFGYDALDRLISANGAYGSIAYEYDSVGNRIKKTENGAVTNYFYVAGTNRIAYSTGAEAATYEYDANGNMTNDGVNTYEYEVDGIPLPGVAGNPGRNPYPYAEGNPVNAIDPLGLRAVMDVGAGGADEESYGSDGGGAVAVVGATITTDVFFQTRLMLSRKSGLITGLL